MSEITLMATSRLETLLHRGSPSDPRTFAAVSLGVTIVALFASFLPAYRAAGIDPIATLRGE
ncbi:MAG TPA: hypothetical protein VLK65_16995 [Vicinamibacteria bacterium]|nr:hypothetical protein [Vicinamibacteria bacterium]